MTWKKLTERYTTLQLMEVVGLVGCYTTMAMVTKTFDIQIEESEATTENLAALRQYKIGREACRARVCQYVSISVVAVSLKKKTKKHTLGRNQKIQGTKRTMTRTKGQT